MTTMSARICTAVLAMAAFVAPAASAQAPPGPQACPDRPLSSAPIEYPPAASRACDEGRVVVGLCVDAQGRPQTVELLRSSGSSRLDEATMRWACRAARQPATDAAGHAVASCAAVLDFTWRLQDFPRWLPTTSHAEILPDPCADRLPPGFRYQANH